MTEGVGGEGGVRKRLIVTADDFGASPEVNEAVIRGCREGVLRFASLMVAEPFAAEAARRAREECPGLKLGLHLVLCCGQSLLGGALCGPAGRFPDDPVACGLRYFFDRGLDGALQAELRAQFELFLALGLPPGHVDGHLNIHVHPVVFPLAARLAREYGFSRIRLPGGELALSLRFPSRRRAMQLTEACVFALLRAYLRRAFGDPRVSIADRTYGLLRSGLMGEDYVLDALQALPAGVTELYFHPSADPRTLAVERPAPGHRSISELQTLLSARVRQRIEELGIELL